MSIYLDSAIAAEARHALSLGWVAGITTNPTLLAQAGLPPAEALKLLAETGFSEIFYQLFSSSLEEMRREADQARQILGAALVLKLPPSEASYTFTARYHAEFPCCITALYSPAQALVAQAAGAQYTVVYVNRATRLMGDGLGLVASLAKVLQGSSTQLIAASLKSSDEAWQAAAAGAQHLTLPWGVLRTLNEHPLSSAALAEFQAKGAGLNQAGQS